MLKPALTAALSGFASLASAPGTARGPAHPAPPALPLLNLTLTPLYPVPDAGPATVPSGINVTLRLRPGPGRLAAHLPLLALVLQRGPTPAPRYDPPNGLTAHDGAGPLPLVFADADPVAGPRTWAPARDPVGEEVVVTFFAPPRDTDNRTTSGPRDDLRRDAGGGLVGKGSGFLPAPPPPRGQEGKAGPGGAGHDPWEVTVAWDLSDAPAGTRAAWSLGDGGDGRGGAVHAVDSPAKLLTDAIFAVGGTLQRSPAWGAPTAPAASPAGRDFTMYWLGEPSWDMREMARSTERIYRSVADYFSSPDPFRVFLRQVENGDGGTGATLSFLLEYSPSTHEEVGAHSLADLLAHEVVHEYALMEPGDPANAWYDEGVANYVGALVGLEPPDSARSLNGYAQAYYTSPAVGLPYDYILDHYWESLHLTRVSYLRGFMYLAQANGMIRAATRGEHSVHDVIRALHRRRAAHEPCGAREFLALLAGYVGEAAARRSWDGMWRGELIVPPAGTFADEGLRLARHDLERFELGFDTNSMRAWRVQGLVGGSNAEKAGVREGDEIVGGRMVWGVADEWGRTMRIAVRREEGREERFEWNPRSDEKVETWLWAPADEADGDEL